MKVDFSDFTSGELEEVKEVLAERFKDLIHINHKRKAAQLIDNMKFLTFDEDEILTLTYEINFSMGDIFQIIGGLRRRGKG